MPWLVAIMAGLNAQIVGNLRIEILSPNLVRIEQKGPKGFEDRPTFHIVGRDGWPGAPATRSDFKDHAEIATDHWKIVVPEPANGLKGVEIRTLQGELIYAVDGKESNSAWIPSPGKMPKAWPIADSPRIVPGPQGLTPDDGDPNSGWDLGNDAPDVYVFLAPDYKTLRTDFLHLTGPVEMPPLYALGFTDSRYYAYKQQEALDRMDEYRQRQIPIDTFVVDTDWRIGGSHGYDVDKRLFPDMPAFFKAAHDRHIHVMFNDHPEPQGDSALDPKELEYRYKNLGGLLGEGLDVWWYDRNWGVSLHDPLPGLRHEVWGMKLYRDMTLKAKPDLRPLIMANVDGIDNGYRNRPPDMAAHRYPVQWTGDTRSEWSFLRRGVENAVVEGVEGLNPWVNEDLGGHIGKPAPDLYIRYLQFGSVCPFMRVHCTKGRTREPWAFGPDAERIVPEYIRMRYRLMPLFYAAARQAFESGEPILRRLDLEFPKLQNVPDDQFLIGDSLLVAPIAGGKEAQIVPTSAFPAGLQGEYFANKDLTGDPTVRRDAANLDFDWGTDAPDPSLPSDYFSARFTGKITVPTDHPYRLQLTGDDGVRLWVDGQEVIDKWEAQDSVTTEAAIDLPPGSTHDIKVEYMDLQYNAVLKMRWRPVLESSVITKRSCLIPSGHWIDVWTGKRLSGPQVIEIDAPLEQLPMYLREGAILPIGPDVQWTGERDWSNLGLEVVPGNGDFSLYEDDGSSLGYAQGQFRKTEIEVRQSPDALRVTVSPSQGDFSGALAQRSWTLRILAAPNLLGKQVWVDGNPVVSRVIPAEKGQPFRNAGGEPTGSIIEVQIPASPTSTGHVVLIGH